MHSKPLVSQKAIVLETLYTLPPARIWKILNTFIKVPPRERLSHQGVKTSALSTLSHRLPPQSQQRLLTTLKYWRSLLQKCGGGGGGAGYVFSGFGASWTLGTHKLDTKLFFFILLLFCCCCCYLGIKMLLHPSLYFPIFSQLLLLSFAHSMTAKQEPKVRCCWMTCNLTEVLQGKMWSLTPLAVPGGCGIQTQETSYPWLTSDPCRVPITFPQNTMQKEAVRRVWILRPYISAGLPPSGQ